MCLTQLQAVAQALHNLDICIYNYKKNRYLLNICNVTVNNKTMFKTKDVMNFFQIIYFYLRFFFLLPIQQFIDSYKS